MTDRRFESIGNILNKSRPRPPVAPTTESDTNPTGPAVATADRNATATDDQSHDHAQPNAGGRPPASEPQPATVSDIRAPRRTSGEEKTADDPQPTLAARRAGSKAGESPNSAAPHAGPAPASAAAEGGVRRVALRLDPDLHAGLTAEASRQQSSHGDVVLTALERAHAAGALHKKAVDETTSSSMFPRLQGRRNPQPTVLTEIRLHAKAVESIDHLVTTHQMASRTELITQALDWYLRTHRTETSD